MQPIDENVKKYYKDTLQQHGFTARGVGWKNEAAQHIRFEQLAKIAATTNFSVNDLGCGSGDFFNYLRASCQRIDFTYRRYDVLAEMVAYAGKKFAAATNARFHCIQNPEQMQMADYTIASGIFNLKYGQTDDQWLSYIFDTIKIMNSRSIKGFAFNMLTSYSDKEWMQDHLYYADPLPVFDFCKKNISKNVALLHDYHEYDFTILIKK